MFNVLYRFSHTFYLLAKIIYVLFILRVITNNLLFFNNLSYGHKSVHAQSIVKIWSKKSDIFLEVMW